MIRYALICDRKHEFEVWFKNSADYDKQAEAGLVECPHCGSRGVTKAPMAPAVRTSRAVEARNERAVAMAMAAKVRQHIKENFDYVGDKFAEEARKMHAGESEERAIWGEATPEEAQALAADDIPAAPLPPALAPVQPKKVN